MVTNDSALRLNAIVRQFLISYDGERRHMTRDHLPPGWDRAPQFTGALKPGDVVCTTRLGGHLKSYARRAA